MRQKDFGEIGTRGRWLPWETLIIVLGVLIAFAVNDYWSDRQNRDLELQYLKRLPNQVCVQSAVYVFFGYAGNELSKWLFK